MNIQLNIQDGNYQLNKPFMNNIQMTFKSYLKAVKQGYSEYKSSTWIQF